MARTRKHEKMAERKQRELLRYLRKESVVRGTGSFVFLLASDLCDQFEMTSRTLLNYLDGLLEDGSLDQYESIRGVGLKVWLPSGDREDDE